MAPVATQKQQPKDEQLINPFYSPSTADDGDEQYQYAQYKVRAILWNYSACQCVFQPTFPDVSWAPLKEVNVVDRGLGADPAKKNLLSAASKVVTLTPTIGTELHGVDLRRLSDVQKDELCV
jgi:sulfonate dioxygenase